MTWDQVKAFYTEKLGSDWKVSDEITQESEAFSANGLDPQWR